MFKERTLTPTWALATATATVTLFAVSAFALGTDSQVEPDLDYGSFEDPSAVIRPRFRYWLPDASVELDQVRADLADAARIGAGGVELLGYYDYGQVELSPDPVPTDWTVYGWGTPAWRQVQDTALQAAKNYNLTVDLTLGPNQGAGVPAPVDTEGLQWDIQPFNVTIPVGGNYSAVIPGWGTGPLISASTALVVNTTAGTAGPVIVLSEASLTDVTADVDSNGRLELSLPATAAGDNYTLFANYLVHTQYREQQTPDLVVGVPQSPVEYFVQNGSWVVDHFSAQGAELVETFWRDYLLNGTNGTTLALLQQVGNYLWEDSQEYPANLLWTSGLPDLFLQNRGYEIAKYIPLLFGPRLGLVLPGTPTSPRASYILDSKDQGSSYVFDYRQTVSAELRSAADSVY